MTTVPAASIHIAAMPDMNKVWSEALEFATLSRYPQGHYLVLNNKPSMDFCYLSKGRISILHGASNGRFQTMMYLESGNLFNVGDVLGRQLTDFIDPGCQFYCLEKVEVWHFPGELLTDEAFIIRYPHLIANLMASMGVKLLLMHNTLANAGTGGTMAKVCRFAFNLSRANNNALEINPRISQKELANLFGVHRTTLARVLLQLKEMGVIRQLTAKRLSIGNLDLLQRLAAD